MNMLMFQVLGLLVLAVIITFTGIRLKVKGRPYKASWVNLHKLLALGFIVLAAFLFAPASILQIEVSPDGLIAALPGLSVITSLVTGGLISHRQPGKSPMHAVHRLSSILLFALSGLLARLMLA